MRIAIISTFRHPSRLPFREHNFMQPAAPELIAALCPQHAEIELYNEKERAVPLDRHFDLAFFSYMDAYFDHTRVLSEHFRRRGITTVAGGRHVTRQRERCAPHFDALVIGEPEGNVPALISDFERGELQPVYDNPFPGAASIGPYRWDLVDFASNRRRGPTIEASRGCPFSCNFCVLTGWEKYRYRPVADVIRDIETRMQFNRHYFGLLSQTFSFYDNNLGGSPKYLRSLCEALIPLRKTWGCSLTFNILQDRELVRLMARAGCRYVYTGLESLNPDSIAAMNKRQNKLAELRSVLHFAASQGILVSTGLLVGSDGDTNDYLTRLPELLTDISFHSVTFLGIVSPYPGTPFHAELALQGRLRTNTKLRDLDGYTLCHRPRRLHPSEAVEHYRSLTRKLSSLRSVTGHYLGRLGLSDRPGYRALVLLTGSEIRNISRNLLNPHRTYLAGSDEIETWDLVQLRSMGLAPALLSPGAAAA